MIIIMINAIINAIFLGLLSIMFILITSLHRELELKGDEGIGALPCDM